MNKRSFNSKFVLADKYRLKHHLSKGAQSTVVIADAEGKDVVVKMYEAADPWYESEVDILSQFTHPGIIKLLDHAKNATLRDETGTRWTSTFAVFEYDPQCLELFDAAKTCALDEGYVLLVFAQIVDAVAYLHARDIAHRDLKLENILINYDTCKVTLIDFGYATKDAKNARHCLGTLAYMAPEVNRYYRYDGLKCDIFSLGVILYTLLHGQYPFGPKNDKRPLTNWDTFWAVGRECSDEFKDLVWKLLDFSPEKRPDIQTIKHHPWMTK